MISRTAGSLIYGQEAGSGTNNGSKTESLAICCGARVGRLIAFHEGKASGGYGSYTKPYAVIGGSGISKDTVEMASRKPSAQLDRGQVGV